MRGDDRLQLFLKLIRGLPAHLRAETMHFGVQARSYTEAGVFIAYHRDTSRPNPKKNVGFEHPPQGGTSYVQFPFSIFFIELTLVIHKNFRLNGSGDPFYVLSIPLKKV